MPFLVETGAGVAGANSLASVAYARDYAALRGRNLPTADSALQVLLVLATDYIRALSFVGVKTYAGQQYLPWPRTGLIVDDVAIPADVIPTAITDAVAQLAVEQAAGVDIRPTRISGATIKREKVGPLETEYAVNSSGSGQATMPAVDSLLSPFVASSAVGVLCVGRG